MKRLDSDEADDVGALSLYDRFAATIFDYLSQQLASRQDAEDLLVEVFLAAHNQPMLFLLSDERQLAWLRRVAKNKVVDHYRHNAVVRLLSLEQAFAQWIALSRPNSVPCSEKTTSDSTRQLGACHLSNNS